jgi:hypothetical protein
MKKITKILFVFAVVTLAAFTKANAQVDIGVNLRLNRPAAYENNERVHPNRPSARHVWVAEEWVWEGGRYTYKPGYWALPPRDRAVWIKGQWVKREYRAGYKWTPGHWFYPR